MRFKRYMGTYKKGTVMKSKGKVTHEYNYIAQKGWTCRLDKTKIASVLEAQKKCDVNLSELGIFICITTELWRENEFPDFNTYNILIGIGGTDNDWFNLGSYGFDKISKKYSFVQMHKDIMELLYQEEIDYVNYICAEMINSFVSFRCHKPAPFTAAEIKKKFDAAMKES